MKRGKIWVLLLLLALLACVLILRLPQSGSPDAAAPEQTQQEESESESVVGAVEQSDEVQDAAEQAEPITITPEPEVSNMTDEPFTPLVVEESVTIDMGDHLAEAGG